MGGYLPHPAPWFLAGFAALLTWRFIQAALDVGRDADEFIKHRQDYIERVRETINHPLGVGEFAFYGANLLYAVEKLTVVYVAVWAAFAALDY
jgi:hypothetical protein